MYRRHTGPLNDFGVSISLLKDDSRVRRHVLGGGKGLRPPKYEKKGNDGSKKITHGKPQLSDGNQNSSDAHNTNHGFRRYLASLRVFLVRINQFSKQWLCTDD